MDVLSLIMSSNRIFTFGDPEQLAVDDIKLIASAGQVAPYIGTKQGIHLLVVNNRELIGQIARISEENVTKASLVMVCLANIEVAGSIINSIIGGYQAYILGLSTGKAASLVASYDEQALTQLLAIPPTYKITLILYIGTIAEGKKLHLVSEKLENLVSLNSLGKKLA